VNQWVVGLRELESFVAPYTPEWAAKETGIASEEIVEFAHEIAQDKPAVIFHPGWMMARYKDSFYSSRTSYILNALMGSFEAPGGLFFQKGPGDAGKKGLNTLMDTIPKPKDKRVDGCGWKYKHFESGPGLLHLLYPAILSQDPYPVKAYIVFRHDPLLSLPDPEAQKKALDKLDLIVAIDSNYSETGWFADVLLPSATYLEKSSIIRTGKGLKPQFDIRRQAIEPRNEAKPDWWIFKQLAERLGRFELGGSVKLDPVAGGQKTEFITARNYRQFPVGCTGVVGKSQPFTDFNRGGFVVHPKYHDLISRHRNEYLPTGM